jgi:general secretion pathway protein N
MPSRRRLIVAGVLTFVIGLVLLFPARVAFHWILPPGVAASGIKGTVWRGSARLLLVNGLSLRDIKWRSKPLALFTARASYAIAATPPGGFLESDVAITLTGNLHLSDLSASLPLTLLQQAVRVPGLGGMANVKFEHLRIADGLPVAATGSIDVAGLVVPLPSATPVGDYRAEFVTQEDGVTASVEDTDGVVDLAGNLQITDDRSYQFLGQIAPKSNTPPALRQQLQFLGSANDRGQHELRFEGQL